MCCAVAAVMLVGPRAGLIVWWIAASERFGDAFNGFLLPLVGFLFAPWTTLAYVLVFAGGVNDWDWVWIVLGILLDLSAYGGGAKSRY